MTVRPVALTPAERDRIASVERIATGTGSIEALVGMLKDPSWSVRREVVRALAAGGLPAAVGLCNLLRHTRDNEAAIAAAVDALVANPSDILDEVAKLTTEHDPAIIADAAQVLGRRRDARAVGVLMGLVLQPDDNVAVAAIEGLGHIGGPRAIDALVAATRSDNFFRVFPAIDVLARCGDPRAIPPLAALSQSSMYRTEVARALGKTGESAAVAPLAVLLSHSSEAVVRVAAVALADLQARHIEKYGNQDAPEAALRAANIDAGAVAWLTRSLASATSDEQVAIASVLGAIGGEAAAVGLRVLLDAQGATGDAAAAALKRLGRDSDLQLREALHEGDSARRKILLPIIARAAVQAELVECLSDSDASVRVLACSALARVGATASVAHIFALLSDPDPRVVQAATGAIQSLGSSQTKALALAYAKDAPAPLRRGAMHVLSYFGYSEALPLFLEALSGDDARTREAALAGLALLEAPAALDGLLAQASSKNEKTRAIAMRALGQVTRADPRVEARLLEALHDDEAWVRYYACQALGRLGAEAATAPIEALINDSAGQVRVAAIEALAHLRSPNAHEALRNAAHGEDPDMQRAALIGLGLTRRSENVAVLIEAASGSDSATRLVALSALAESGSELALPALAAATRDDDENVRSAAVTFLAALPQPEATAALIGLVHTATERERVVVLLSAPNPGRVKGLTGALAAADDELAAVVCSALARLHSDEAQRALLDALSQGSVPVRRAAAASIASIRSPQAQAALRRAADTDVDAQVRQVCAVLLRL